VAEGSFGNVYKGHLGNRVLAIKVLKVKKLKRAKLHRLRQVIINALQLLESIASKNSLGILVRGCHMATTFAQ
jgi:hypothetical protein